MLHRITSVWVLCIGLLVAGVPAPACCAASAPAHDCCTHLQQLPGPEHRSYALAAALVHGCCVAGGADIAPISARDARHDAGKHPQRADPPVLHVSFASSTVASAQPRAKNGFAIPDYFPFLSTLYLSTGRLRL